MKIFFGSPELWQKVNGVMVKRHLVVQDNDKSLESPYF